MLKTQPLRSCYEVSAYHLGEGRVLKTASVIARSSVVAYHLGEGRVLKTHVAGDAYRELAYHLGEGRVLKTAWYHALRHIEPYHLGEGRMRKDAITVQDKLESSIKVCSRWFTGDVPRKKNAPFRAHSERGIWAICALLWTHE